MNSFKAKLLLLATATFLFSHLSHAQAEMDARVKANNIYQKMTGIKPSKDTLDAMEALIKDGKDIEAANLALETNDFYRNVAQLAKTWLDTENTGNIRIPLNDYVATVVGMVRDDVPFNQSLSADIIYNFAVDPGTAYAINNNDHYAQAETQGLSLKDGLQQAVQSESHPELDESTAAGLLTTRGFADVYFKDGTNRRPYVYYVQYTLCKSLQEVMDTTVPGEDWINRDVTRAPSGDPAIFHSYCKGCHSRNVDQIKGAHCKYEWNADDGDGSLSYLPTTQNNNFKNNFGDATNPDIAAKCTRNADVYPTGHKITDDNWRNHFIYGNTKVFGWKGQSSGKGLKSLGSAMLKNDQFSQCMAEQVFKKVCYHVPSSSKEKNFVASLANDFGGKFNFALKPLFSESAVFCTEN
ncbi:MAG: hypothetical protein H6620_03730 [Halobacteriovoraceae bacterium]|nr:hypothetical protein [Halobacteriovoraceae bacterium]